MSRFFRSNRKGQFFIIAAVIIVSALFSIYGVYLGYYAVDTSIVQDLDSAYMLKDIEQETMKMHNFYRASACSEMRSNMNSSKLFIERSGLESGNLINFKFNSSRGCINTTFNLEVITRDTNSKKNFSLIIPNTPTFLNKYNSATFGSNVDSNNNVNVGDTLATSSPTSPGTIVYYFDPQKEVVWLNHSSSTTPASTPDVIITWLINDSRYCSISPNFCEYSSFESLPDEFRWLKEKIQIQQGSVAVTSANVTYTVKT